MAKRKEEPARENRISLEIIVDAYDAGERAMGWYYYLQDALTFPFKAECIKKRAISPLRPGEGVEVVGMPPEKECAREIFVTVGWEGRTFGVPLVQLRCHSRDKKTKEAVADWHYWVERGYEFA